MDFVKVCRDMGASNAAELPVEKLVFQPELRALCEQNACGRFGRSYTCPPAAGDVEELIATVKSFSNAVIWQNIYQLEDSFDFGGMIDAQKKHNDMTIEIARQARTAVSPVLILAAGGCSLCEACAIQTNEPCRHKDDALSSLEAYGINVSKICDASDMKYINGVNTVTYFSGVFY